MKKRDDAKGVIPPATLCTPAVDSENTNVELHIICSIQTEG